MTDNNVNNNLNSNLNDTPDLADRLTHLAMMLRRMDMAGRPGRSFGGMRAGQGRVLHILTLQSPIPQRELAYMLGVRPQSLSELLGKLETAGYVERRRDDTDRRTFMVDITEEGRDAASNVPDVDDPFDVLSEEEQSQFGDMLDRVSVALREKFPDSRRPDGRRGHHGHRHGGHGHGGHSGHGPDGGRAHWRDGDMDFGAGMADMPGMGHVAEMSRMAMMRFAEMGRGPRFA